jgi:hypothetical protein
MAPRGLTQPWTAFPAVADNAQATSDPPKRDWRTDPSQNEPRVRQRDRSFRHRVATRITRNRRVAGDGGQTRPASHLGEGAKIEFVNSSPVKARPVPEVVRISAPASPTTALSGGCATEASLARSIRRTLKAWTPSASAEPVIARTPEALTLAVPRTVAGSRNTAVARLGAEAVPPTWADMTAVTVVVRPTAVAAPTRMTR